MSAYETSPGNAKTRTPENPSQDKTKTHTTSVSMSSLSLKLCKTELELTEVWRDVEDHVGAADPNTRRGTGTDLLVHEDTLSMF